MQGAEVWFPPLEKLALALVVAAQHLRPYFQAHPIHMLTDAPLRQILLAWSIGLPCQWAIVLSEFDIEYHTYPAVKSKALEDFLVEVPNQEH